MKLAVPSAPNAGPGKDADGEPMVCRRPFDLTTIDARGARPDTLRTWLDEIGKPIDPSQMVA